MSEVRWARLAESLAAVGVAARVDVTPYPGGVNRSVTLKAGNSLIEVSDAWWRKNPDIWIGWQVHIEGRQDSIVKRTWPVTKKRSEVVAAVREALAGANGRP